MYALTYFILLADGFIKYNRSETQSNRRIVEVKYFPQTSSAEIYTYCIPFGGKEVCTPIGHNLLLLYQQTILCIKFHRGFFINRSNTVVT